MRKIKIRKDTPLGPTPEVKDTTNYSRKEKKAKENMSRPLTEDEKAVIIIERPKIKKSWKEMQKDMPPSF
jgi:hypothetical protein